MSQHKREDGLLADHIQETYHANRQVYGSPPIHAELRAWGISCSRKRVARLMREKWRTWVNGGAWLTIGGQRVDFLYRNSDFVSSTIDDCNAVKVRSDYWQQPAYGFHSFMYGTEIAICRPLYDPDQVIERLKAKLAHCLGHHPGHPFAQNRGVSRLRSQSKE